MSSNRQLRRCSTELTELGPIISDADKPKRVLQMKSVAVGSDVTNKISTTLLQVAGFNTLSQMWVAAMSVVFIPLYLKFLGAEQFALIGIYLLIRTVISLFNGGAVPILGQQFARHATHESSLRHLAVLLNTSTLFFGVVAIFVCTIIHHSSGYLVDIWLNVSEARKNTTTLALQVASVALFPQFMEAPLRGMSVGLSLQKPLAVLFAIMATFRGAGAAVLVWKTQSISSYFWWQAIIGFITCGTMYFICWNRLGMPRGINFEPRRLLALRHFATGVISISVLGMMLSQLDKVVAPKVLTLAELAYYNIAATICAMLFTVSATISQAFYPRLCQQQYNKEGCRDTYELNIKSISIFLAPIVAVLSVGGDSILYFWLGNEFAAEITSQYLLPMLFAVLVMSLNLPLHNLQLATGRTNEILKINFFALFLFLVLLANYWVELNGFTLASILAAVMGCHMVASCLLVDSSCVRGMSRKRLVVFNIRMLCLVLIIRVFSSGLLLFCDSMLEEIILLVFTFLASAALIFLFGFKRNAVGAF